MMNGRIKKTLQEVATARGWTYGEGEADGIEHAYVCTGEHLGDGHHFIVESYDDAYLTERSLSEALQFRRRTTSISRVFHEFAFFREGFIDRR